MMLSIEDRLGRLEAVEGIRNLMTDYVYRCDNGGTPSEIAELFTNDGVWRGDRGFAQGLYQGTEQLTEFFRLNAVERVSWSMHFLMDPAIGVAEDGQSASGVWYLWQPSTLIGHGPHWVAGWYENAFELTSEGWRIKDMFLRFGLIADTQTSWEDNGVYGRWTKDEPLTW